MKAMYAQRLHALLWNSMASDRLVWVVGGYGDWAARWEERLAAIIDERLVDVPTLNPKATGSARSNNDTRRPPVRIPHHEVLCLPDDLPFPPRRVPNTLPEIDERIDTANQHLKKLNKKTTRLVRGQDVLLELTSELLLNSRRQLAQGDQLLENSERQLTQGDQLLENTERQLAQGDQLLENSTRQLAQGDQLLANSEQLLHGQDRIIGSIELLRSDLNQQLGALPAAIATALAPLILSARSKDHSSSDTAN